MRLKRWLFILWVLCIKNASASIFILQSTSTIVTLSVEDCFINTKFDLDITQHFSLLGHNVVTDVTYAEGESCDVIIHTDAGQLTVSEQFPDLHPPLGYKQVVVSWQISKEVSVPLYRRHFRQNPYKTGTQMVCHLRSHTSPLSVSRRVIMNEISASSDGTTPISPLVEGYYSYDIYSLGKLMGEFVAMEDYKKIQFCLRNQVSRLSQLKDLSPDIQTLLGKIFQLMNTLNLNPLALIQFITRIFIPEEDQGDERAAAEVIIRAFYAQWEKNSAE